MTAPRTIEVAQVGGGWWQVREAGVRVIRSTRRRPAADLLAVALRDSAAVLDRYLPKRGQCLLCGVPGEDQTHRVIDAIAGRIRAGDDDEATAADYGFPVEVAHACLDWTERGRS